MTGRQFEGKVAVAVTAFALGLAAGLLMRGGAREVVDRVRRGRAQRDYDRTVEYDENLPDSLGRREPAPHEGQPRFGGTGALGISPEAAAARAKNDG